MGGKAFWDIDISSWFRLLVLVAQWLILSTCCIFVKFFLYHILHWPENVYCLHVLEGIPLTHILPIVYRLPICFRLTYCGDSVRSPKVIICDPESVPSMNKSRGNLGASVDSSLPNLMVIFFTSRFRWPF